MTPTQQIASVVRQVVAVAVFVFGILTQALSGLHLPPAISVVMTAAGAGIMAVEHYVSDPSTGSSSPPPMPSAEQISQMAAGLSSGLRAGVPVAPVAPVAPLAAVPAPPAP